MVGLELSLVNGHEREPQIISGAHMLNLTEKNPDCSHTPQVHKEF